MFGFTPEKHRYEDDRYNDHPYHVPSHSRVDGDNILHLRHHYDIKDKSAPAYYVGGNKRSRLEYYEQNKPPAGPSHTETEDPVSHKFIK